ncbi:hypothetical protein [Thermococcus sp. 21S7]|uniref:hypothetical protein n=1 Tax=Thermococcus sp. 21S7 TaxID=1638221 RepID=UPI00143C9C45|nr:hypothetical protein [Thermococcus sp. 21S7]NJE61223.1 hypothetical protein [Thermococcus sp. 21S7]
MKSDGVVAVPTIEFESPRIKFNDVMDTIVNNNLSLLWVYLDDMRGSFVMKVFVPCHMLMRYLLELASVLRIPTEVSIVESEDGSRMIHEAFLITVSHPSGDYPVFILFEYYESRYYPSKITIGLHSKSPKELVDAVLNLSIGRVSIADAEVVKTITKNNAKFLYLKTNAKDKPRTEYEVARNP